MLFASGQVEAIVNYASGLTVPDMNAAREYRPEKGREINLCLTIQSKLIFGRFAKHDAGKFI